MAYDFHEFRRLGASVREEHRRAVDDSEKRGRAVARAEGAYRKLLSTAMSLAAISVGKTMAEAVAKGEADVAEALERLKIAEAEDRAGVQRVKLAEADRAILLTQGSWSKSQENNEQ